MECGPTATDSCWLFCAAQERVRRPGRGLLEDLYRRGLEGQKLKLIVTDGCAGLIAALQTVYPRVPHQRCWVHNTKFVQAARKRDLPAITADARDIYTADSIQQARTAFETFQRRWQTSYPGLVHCLEKDLPDLLTFYQFPKALWRKLRTTNGIERQFVEVRRRTRPMVCFVRPTVWIASSLRSSTSLTSGGKTAPSEFLHKQLDITTLHRYLEWK